MRIIRALGLGKSVSKFVESSSESVDLKQEDVRLVRGAEALYYFLPESFTLGRTLVNPIHFLDDPLPSGAIPFAFLSIQKVHGSITGGQLFYWSAPDAQAGILDRALEDLEAHYKPAIGHPRIKAVALKPRGLIFWHESANRKMASSHLVFPAPGGIKFDLAGGASSAFYPVGLVEHYGTAKVFSERYVRDPSQFGSADPRRARLSDFHSAVDNFGRKVTIIQTGSSAERMIAGKIAAA